MFMNPMKATFSYKNTCNKYNNIKRNCDLFERIKKSKNFTEEKYLFIYRGKKE